MNVTEPPESVMADEITILRYLDSVCHTFPHYFVLFVAFLVMIGQSMASMHLENQL